MPLSPPKLISLVSLALWKKGTLIMGSYLPYMDEIYAWIDQMNK
jgi:hypothetical protein